MRGQGLGIGLGLTKGWGQDKVNSCEVKFPEMISRTLLI